MRASAHRRHAGGLRIAAVGAAYLVLACAVYWPIGPLDATHVVGTCACSDAVQQVWFLEWVPYALGHGLNPLFSDHLNTPAGVNLAVNTSMPLLGLLGWPVTALSNAIAAYNLLLRLGLALSALSMYLVLRQYVRSPAASVLGGLLFGFSPYMLGEGRLHVFLVFLPLLPPLIVVIDRWLIRPTGHPYRYGALVGLLLGSEMLISAELVAVFVILIVIAMIPVAISHHRDVPSRLPLLLRGLVGSAVAGSLVGGYVAWMFLAGPQRPDGAPHSVSNLDSYHADLLSLVIPSKPQLLRPLLFHRGAQHFVKGNLDENGFYLGVPLLAVLTVGSVWLRRRTLVLSFATLGVVSFLLALGTRLAVANHVTDIALPMAAITGIPALQEIGPTRFALGIQLAASVLLAVVADGLLERHSATRYRAVVATAVLPLVALVPLLPSSLLGSVPAPTPNYFVSAAVDQIPANATALTYPFPSYSSNEAMLWQAASGMRFRMPGGEVYVPGPTGRSMNYPRGDLPALLWATLVQGGPQGAARWVAPSAARRAELVAALRGYVASHRIDAMLVASTGVQGRWVAAMTRSAFGAPRTIRGDLAVWIRPRAP